MAPEGGFITKEGSETREKSTWVRRCAECSPSSFQCSESVGCSCGAGRSHAAVKGNERASKCSVSWRSVSLVVGLAWLM